MYTSTNFLRLTLSKYGKAFGLTLSKYGKAFGLSATPVAY